MGCSILRLEKANDLYKIVFLEFVLYASVGNKSRWVVRKNVHVQLLIVFGCLKTYTSLMRIYDVLQLYVQYPLCCLGV